MLKFDKLKLAYNETVTELNGKRFNTLIHSENIHQWEYKVKKENYNNVVVRLAHVTEDIYIGETVDYLTKIARIPFKNLSVTPYRCTGKGQLTGVVISTKKRKRGSKCIYLTLYDKYIESGMQEQYKGVLRLEQKITTFRDIRNKLKIKSNTLDEVLSSSSNPINNLLLDIYNQIINLKMKPTLLTGIEEQVYDCFFQKFEYQWSNIRIHLKLSQQSPYHIRKVKAIFTELVEEKNNLNYFELFKPILTATTIKQLT